MVTFFWLMLRRIRRAVARNLQVVRGRASFWKRERWIFSVFWNWAWCRTERYGRLQRVDESMELTTEGLEHWKALSSRPEGFVVLTAHLGNFETGSFLAEDVIGRRVHAVRSREPDPRAQEFVEQLLTREVGERCVMHYLDDDEAILLDLLRALREGDIVGLTMDRLHPGMRRYEATMFGHHVELPGGWAHLARAAGVPALPTFLVRRGRQRYRFSVGSPIHVARTVDRDADCRAAIALAARELEARIVAHPTQWFCFGSFFDGREEAS